MKVHSLCRRKVDCISVGQRKYMLPSTCAYLCELVKDLRLVKAVVTYQGVGKEDMVSWSCRC